MGPKWYLDTSGSCLKRSRICSVLIKSAQQGKQQRSSMSTPLCRMTPTNFLLGLPKLCKTVSWSGPQVVQNHSLCPAQHLLSAPQGSLISTSACWQLPYVHSCQPALLEHLTETVLFSVPVVSNQLPGSMPPCDQVAALPPQFSDP